jgi:hypothetical protein
MDGPMGAGKSYPRRLIGVQQGEKPTIIAGIGSQDGARALPHSGTQV